MRELLFPSSWLMEGILVKNLLEADTCEFSA